MTNKTISVIAVLALVLGGVAVIGYPNQDRLGGQFEEYNHKTFQRGITVQQGASIDGGMTIDGGTLNVTTSNTATSTVIAGCWQFYATSTATAHRFQASTTPGVMYSQYGSCPNL